jgi:hypothetical protein
LKKDVVEMNKPLIHHVSLREEILSIREADMLQHESCNKIMLNIPWICSVEIEMSYRRRRPWHVNTHSGGAVFEGNVWMYSTRIRWEW